MHSILRLKGTHRILIISGSNLIFVDSITGKLLASVPGLGKAVKTLDATDLPKDRIRTAVYHPETKRLALVSDDKLLQIWDTHTYTLLNSRSIVKRATCLLFNPEGDIILVGDKFGDCYRFLVKDESKPTLLLGHVSILTDMVWTNDHKFLITADRDEKIRINKYPATFEIERFCLGHTEYVSKLLCLPFSTRFISGGGDPWLILWDQKQGR